LKPHDAVRGVKQQAPTGNTVHHELHFYDSPKDQLHGKLDIIVDGIESLGDE
jgi:hypothetical protein